MPKTFLAKARIDEALYNDLRKIATRDYFENNMSRVVRYALQEFRDSWNFPGGPLKDPRRRRAHTKVKAGPGRSS